MEIRGNKKLERYIFTIHQTAGNSSLWSADRKAKAFEAEVMRLQYATQCPDYSFKTHIFSTDPLIIYIEDFLTQEEAKYLLNSR